MGAEQVRAERTYRASGLEPAGRDAVRLAEDRSLAFGMPCCVDAGFQCGAKVDQGNAGPACVEVDHFLAVAHEEVVGRSIHGFDRGDADVFGRRVGRNSSDLDATDHQAPEPVTGRCRNDSQSVGRRLCHDRFHLLISANAFLFTVRCVA